MLNQISSKLVGGNNIRIPVLFALAIAFSALLLIFTLILDVWATSSRQEALSELAEQIDDQLYRKTEDVSYQLLNAAGLFSSRDKVVKALEEDKKTELKRWVKEFYDSSNDSLLNHVQLFSNTGELLLSYGSTSHQQLFSLKQKAKIETQPSTGTFVNDSGEVHIYAIHPIVSSKGFLAYFQISKSLTELITEIAYLNRVELLLLINKNQVTRSTAEKYQSLIGMKADWNLFDQLVMCSLTQGNINLDLLSPIINSALSSTKQDATYLQDKLELNSKRMNLGLLPVHNFDGDNIGRLLLLKDISEAYSNYQTSLTITSVSFGIIISLIFVYFWFFLGRIERKTANAEQDIINARIQAEQARDDAETSKQQAEDANKIKSEFLAKMSHELRTPLNAIIGITEMMAEDAEEFGDEDYKEPLGRVLRSGKHLLSLINDILDLSKIEAGKMELHPESFDVSLFIGDINRTCEPLAQKNNNQLQVDVNEQVKNVYADSTRLKQVLLNLISNACKFTNDGSINLQVSPCTLNDGDAVRFKISDSGIGMAPQQLSMLFQDFQQVDSSATRKYEGTGLGLSISRKLAELMGGEIRVTSEEGKGSEFSVYLPLNNSDIAIENAALERNLTSSLEGAGESDLAGEEPCPSGMNNVLIVEDDDNMVQMLKYHFDKKQVHVEVAKDGSQALQKARANIPALITLDINMPNLNGWDTLAAMRADPLLKNIPIVVLTVQEEKQKGLELGASEYLIKPINKEDVAAIVNRFIKVDP